MVYWWIYASLISALAFILGWNYRRWATLGGWIVNHSKDVTNTLLESAAFPLVTRLKTLTGYIGPPLVAAFSDDC